MVFIAQTCESHLSIDWRTYRICDIRIVTTATIRSATSHRRPLRHLVQILGIVVANLWFAPMSCYPMLRYIVHAVVCTPHSFLPACTEL